MSEGDGNTTQSRVIMENIADTAITRFVEKHPEMKPKPDMPPPLKWLGAIGALVLGAAVVGYFNWLTDTVNDMQVTLARMDERQASQVEAADRRDEEQDRRLATLEAYHRSDGQ